MGSRRESDDLSSSALAIISETSLTRAPETQAETQAENTSDANEEDKQDVVNVAPSQLLEKIRSRFRILRRSSAGAGSAMTEERTSRARTTRSHNNVDLTPSSTPAARTEAATPTPHGATVALPSAPGPRGVPIHSSAANMILPSVPARAADYSCRTTHNTVPVRRAASEAGLAALQGGPRTDAEGSTTTVASTSKLFPDLSQENGNKLKVTDLATLCEQIGRLLDYIHSTKRVNQLLYSYPSKMQASLDNQAQELHTISMEAQAALLRIKQIKNQRKAVRKEFRARFKSLTSIKEEEIKVMENYIAQYDKSLMSRWEKIRSSKEKDEVESFMHDIQAKQKALDYLHTLAVNKLNQLEGSTSQCPTTEESRPVSLALRRLSSNGGARSSSARWRTKHHERAMRIPAGNSHQLLQDKNSNPSMPLAAAPFSLNLGPALSGSTFGGGSSRISSASTVSSDVISTNTLPITSAGSVTTASAVPGIQSTPERRSILQALFSDITQAGTHDNLPINAVMPRIVATNSIISARIGGTRGTNDNSIDSSSTPSNNDIELYTVNDSSQNPNP